MTGGPPCAALVLPMNLEKLKALTWGLSAQLALAYQIVWKAVEVRQ